MRGVDSFVVPVTSFTPDRLFRPSGSSRLNGKCLTHGLKRSRTTYPLRPQSVFHSIGEAISRQSRETRFSEQSLGQPHYIINRSKKTSALAILHKHHQGISGPWSEARTITVALPPGPLPAPTLSFPANNARFSPGQAITFIWSNVAGANSYTLQVDGSSSFTSPLSLNQTVVGSNQHTTSTLPTKRLWWRVRANDGAAQPQSMRGCAARSLRAGVRTFRLRRGLPLPAVLDEVERPVGEQRCFCFRIRTIRRDGFSTEHFAQAYANSASLR